MFPTPGRGSMEDRTLWGRRLGSLSASTYGPLCVHVTSLDQRARCAVGSVVSLPLGCACTVATFERCLHASNGSSGVVILSVLSCRDESLPGKDKQDYLIISWFQDPDLECQHFCNPSSFWISELLSLFPSALECSVLIVFSSMI